MFIAVIIFLIVFSGIACLRTKVEENTTGSEGEINTDRAVKMFFTSIEIAIIFAFASIAMGSHGVLDFRTYGVAILLAVVTSLLVGGGPRVYLTQSTKQRTELQSEHQ